MANFSGYNPMDVGALTLQRYAAPQATTQSLLEAVLNNAGKRLSNQKMEAEQPYWGDAAQANLAQTQLGNQKLQELMPFLAPEAKADIDYKRATIKDILEGKIPLTQAQTALTNAQTKYLPEKLAQQKNRFGPAYNFLKFIATMPATTREAFIAEHQDEYNAALSSFGRQMNEELSGRVAVPSQAAPNTSPQQASAPTSLPAEPAIGGALPLGQDRINKLKELYGQQNEVAPGTGFRNTAEQTQKLSDIGKMAVNKKLTTNDMQKRYEASIAVEDLLNSSPIRESFDTLSKYSGLEGAAKAAALRLPHILGGDPVENAKLQSAHDQMQTILSGSIKLLEGIPTSTKGMQQALSYFQQAKQALGSDPKAAFTYFNLGQKLIKAEGRALQKTANPAYQVDRLGAEEKEFVPYGPKDNDSLSKIQAHAKQRNISVDELVKRTAAKHGVSEEKVRKDLGL